MKRLLILLMLLGSLTLIFAACGSGGGSDTPAPDSSNWDELVWDQDNWA